MMACWKRPRARPEDWEPVELPLFKSSRFGDDQDRPIKKSDGSWTYFGADMAYHFQKAQSADQLIDIWGADHAGTVKRIQAAVAALTEGKARFDVKLVQMVRLLRGGEPVKMSKRAGNFVTLADVVREVGKDVVRFTMLTRKADAQMDFDLPRWSRRRRTIRCSMCNMPTPGSRRSGGARRRRAWSFQRPTCPALGRRSWRW
jgi:arginyl-tRNA synthetase